MTQSAFAETIRRLREGAGRSQESLAADLGVTRSAVANWETGISAPRRALLPLIARAFGVPVESIGIPELPVVEA